MTPSEQEEILRRALHAVADTIEPAADGLERIRERLSRPRPLAVAWLLAGWTGLAQPLLLRIEPVLAGAAGRLSDRLAEWLRVMVRSLGTVAERLRPAGVRLHLWAERLRPVGGLLVDAIRMLRPGSGMSRHEKLRAALAFGAAVLIGAAGGFALSDGLPPVISAAGSVFSVFSPSAPQGTSAGKAGSHVHGNGTHFAPGSSSAPGSTHKPNSAPSAACSATPRPSADPPPTPTPTPTPDQTSSATTGATGSTPAQVNASAGTGVLPSTAPNQSSRGVIGGSVGTRPLATPWASPTPTSSTGTSAC